MKKRTRIICGILAGVFILGVIAGTIVVLLA
jgi:hypothetical protein